MWKWIKYKLGFCSIVHIDGQFYVTKRKYLQRVYLDRASGFLWYSFDNAESYAAFPSYAAALKRFEKYRVKVY